MQRDIKESYGDVIRKFTTPRQVRFFLKFIETSKIGDSYRYAYNKSSDKTDDNYMSMEIACTLGRRILSKAGLDLNDFLCMMGHDDDKVASALDKLYETNPDKYLNHVETLRKLGQKGGVEINAGEGVQINIVTKRPEEADEES